METIFALSVTLLSGLLMSRITKIWNLPAVTAYLIAGVLIGPYCLGAFGVKGLGFVSADDVAQYATRVVVMEQGTVAMTGTPEEIFRRAEELCAMGLDVPSVCRLGMALRAAGLPFPAGVFRQEDAERAILALWKEARHAE